TFSIFAVARHGIRDLKLSADRSALEPRSQQIREKLSFVSGGLESIVLSSYDAFLLHGLFLIPPRIDRRHSSALRQISVKEMLTECDAQKLARLIASGSKAPILISPEPLLADIGNDIVRKNSNAPTQPVQYEEVCATIEDEFGQPGVHWLWQDPSTIGDQFNTIREYSVGSVALKGLKNAKQHASIDVRHMNDDYGRIVLENVVEKLRTLV
ncbi:hypothetical protein, partial [Planktotalea sp.]|uniref:hypothetical protein n=1 Tax=Planktotalea sp. TaxID=2029877 RepID=UPI003299B0F1